MLQLMLLLCINIYFYLSHTISSMESMSVCDRAWSIVSLLLVYIYF